MTLRIGRRTIMLFRPIGNPPRVVRTPGMLLRRIPGTPWAILTIDPRKV